MTKAEPLPQDVSMHSCNTGSLIFSVFSLLAGALGCSGSDGPDGAAALDAADGVSPADAEACIVTSSTPATPGSDADWISTYRWLSYLPELRIVRDIAIDAEGKPFEVSSLANSSTYTLLDRAGRVVVSATENRDGELQRSDFARDARGNVVSYSRVYTTRRDLTAAAPEKPIVAFDFVNHYSSEGMLEQHTRTDSSRGTEYEHDAEGRCELIIGSLRAERRDYDADGRLTARTLGPWDPADPVDPMQSEQSYRITHSYDEQGRPLAVEQDGGGPTAAPIDGLPDTQTLWSYADDGSYQIEYIDFTSEAPNDLLLRGATLQMALHRVESWSAGCAAVQASIPVAPGSACVAD